MKQKVWLIHCESLMFWGNKQLVEKHERHSHTEAESDQVRSPTTPIGSSQNVLVIRFFIYLFFYSETGIKNPKVIIIFCFKMDFCFKIEIQVLFRGQNGHFEMIKKGFIFTFYYT